MIKGRSLLKDYLGKCYLVDMVARIALHSANKYCNELLGGKVLRFDPNTKWVFETLVRTGVVESGWSAAYAAAGLYNYTYASGARTMRDFDGQGI